MSESPSPEPESIQRVPYTGRPPNGHLREVRVAYGLETVTISVVETTHSAKTWRGQSKLVSIHQFQLTEFRDHGRDILEEYVTELLLPNWRISEEITDSAG